MSWAYCPRQGNAPVEISSQAPSNLAARRKPALISHNTDAAILRSRHRPWTKNNFAETWATPAL
jgi:hypothetical protein